MIQRRPLRDRCAVVRRARLGLALALLSSLALRLSGPLYADDWPRYRGSAMDGRSAERGLRAEWPAEGPRELWRIQVGGAYSSVVVRGSQACTLESDSEGEYAFCVDRRTGARDWRTRIDDLLVQSHGDGPRSTPTLTETKLLALSGSGRLVALDRKEGRILWQVSVPEELGPTDALHFGYSPAPVVFAGRVVLPLGGREGGFLGAFDLETGDLRWTSGSGTPTYSTPLVVEFGGRELLVAQSVEGVLAFTSEGALAWSHEWLGTPVKAAMPVLAAPDLLIFSMSYDVGALALRMKSDSPPVVAWESRAMRNHFNASVALDGYLFGFDNALLKCIEASTGELLWQKSRLGGKGSLIAADGKLLVLNERGFLRLVGADSEGYEESGGFQALEGRSWSAPTLANGHLLLRDQDEMVAFDLTSDTAASSGREGR